MNQKQLVGEHAATFVEDKMTVGLGTGSTATYMVEALARRVKEEGLDIKCVSTSKVTSELAIRLGLDVKKLEEVKSIDLTIDGADEVSPTLQGIKGGGGAHLFEKIVATNSKRNIWIVDHSKQVDTLGKFPLPLEVIPFGSEFLFEKLVNKGYKPQYRLTENNEKFITDAGNIIIDLHLEKIDKPKQLAKELKSEIGIVEHGLFIDIADQVIVATDDNKVKVIDKN